MSVGFASSTRIMRIPSTSFLHISTRGSIMGRFNLRHFPKEAKRRNSFDASRAGENHLVDSLVFLLGVSKLFTFDYIQTEYFEMIDKLAVV
jgi:hypothetical protein